MEQRLIDLASKSKKRLVSLKNTMVVLQDYESAAKVKELEAKLFPETDEQKKAKEKARKLELLFRMVGVPIDESTCWLIAETLKVYGKKKGKFDIGDAVELKHKYKEIFEID